MAIGIDITQGTDAEIFDDLLEIARCDPGLSASRPTDFQSGAGGFPFPITIFYNQKQQGVTSSNRLLELVKSPSVVMIVGVPFTFVLPGGIPITAVAGGTYPAFLLAPITIYLDVTEANGQSYYVIGKNGQPIDSPRPVTLYHELAHAYHIIKGDIPTAVGAAEVQAETDENAFRAQLGLPLRDPTKHDGGPWPTAPSGVSFPRCKPTEQGWSPGWKCLVATAALGSPQAPQVAALRRARCQFKNLSRWTGMIAGPVLDSYARFSPLVVREMESDPSLRDAVLTFAVQPAFHLVNLVELYLETDRDTPELLEDMRRSLSSYAREVDEAGGSATVLQVAASEVVLARQSFDSYVESQSSRVEEPRWPQDLYHHLANVIRANVSDTTTYAWAFEGLGLVLEQAARIGHGLEMAPDFPSTLGAWLARLPIPIDAQLSNAELREELDLLAERLFNRQYSRELFARHLLARWPNRSALELRSLLRELDYLRADNGQR